MHFVRYNVSIENRPERQPKSTLMKIKSKCIIDIVPLSDVKYSSLRQKARHMAWPDVEARSPVSDMK